ncbi:MAG: TetR/AcrR family transcriptional regulator [Thermoleophilaceae bacterium]
MAKVDPRTARTTAAVLEAAEEVFRREGFHRATIERIAEAAEVSVGTIYFHFGSKEALYLELVERALEVNERYMAEAYDAELSPLEQVLAAGDAYMRFHLDHPGYFRMIALRGLDLAPGDEPPEAERRIAERVDLLVGGVAEGIERAVQAGEAFPVDAWTMSRFVWGAWNGVVALSVREDRLRLDETQLREALALGRRLIVEGCATQKLRDADARVAGDFL